MTAQPSGRLLLDPISLAPLQAHYLGGDVPDDYAAVGGGEAGFHQIERAFRL